MADVNRGNRPLSPHLTIYKPQLTSMTSIFVRITGNALLVSTLMVIWWFMAAATGPDAFATANGFLTSWFGSLIMIVSLWGLWYHLLGGLRHLIWDMGYGVNIPFAEKLSLVMIFGSLALTVLTIVVI